MELDNDSNDTLEPCPHCNGTGFCAVPALSSLAAGNDAGRPAISDLTGGSYPAASIAEEERQSSADRSSKIATTALSSSTLAERDQSKHSNISPIQHQNDVEMNPKTEEGSSSEASSSGSTITTTAQTEEERQDRNIPPAELDPSSGVLAASSAAPVAPVGPPPAILHSSSAPLPSTSTPAPGSASTTTTTKPRLPTPTITPLIHTSRSAPLPTPVPSSASTTTNTSNSDSGLRFLSNHQQQHMHHLRQQQQPQFQDPSYSQLHHSPIPGNVQHGYLRSPSSLLPNINNASSSKNRSNYATSSSSSSTMPLFAASSSSTSTTSNSGNGTPSTGFQYPHSHSQSNAYLQPRPLPPPSAASSSSTSSSMLNRNPNNGGGGGSGSINGNGNNGQIERPTLPPLKQLLRGIDEWRHTSSLDSNVQPSSNRVIPTPDFTSRRQQGAAEMLSPASSQAESSMSNNSALYHDQHQRQQQQHLQQQRNMTTSSERRRYSSGSPHVYVTSGERGSPSGFAASPPLVGVPSRKISSRDGSLPHGMGRLYLGHPAGVASNIGATDSTTAAAAAAAASGGDPSAHSMMSRGDDPTFNVASRNKQTRFRSISPEPSPAAVSATSSNTTHDGQAAISSSSAGDIPRDQQGKNTMSSHQPAKKLRHTGPGPSDPYPHDYATSASVHQLSQGSLSSLAEHEKMGRQNVTHSSEAQRLSPSKQAPPNYPRDVVDPYDHHHASAYENHLVHPYQQQVSDRREEQNILRFNRIDHFADESIMDLTPSIEKREAELEAAIHLATMATGSAQGPGPPLTSSYQNHVSSTEAQDGSLSTLNSQSQDAPLPPARPTITGSQRSIDSESTHYGSAPSLIHESSAESIPAVSPGGLSDATGMQAEAADGSSGTGRYSCKSCGKRFTRPSALAVHSHMHTGAKPFECAVCHRSFSVNSNLRRHMKTHSPEERSAVEQ